MSTFVLVHGAWHGAWCWEKVVPRLEARGHQVVAVDLPSHGDDPAPPQQVTLPDYIDRVSERVDALERGVVLVGHSMGGFVVSQAAEARADRVQKIIYLAAMLPAAGDSMADIRPEPMVAENIATAPDGTLRVAPEIVRDAFYHDCSADDAARAQARLCPQPPLDPAQVFSPTERFAKVERAFIECLEDRVIGIGEQRRGHARTPCARVEQLASGHSPFYSMPDALVDALERLAV